MHPGGGGSVTPAVPMGQLPTIGMVAAPATTGGHVGIGIGIPIMAPLLHPPAHAPQVPSQHTIVSPDSSEDGLIHQNRRPPDPMLPPAGTSSSLHSPSWPTNYFGGMGFPMMMGEGPMLPDQSLYYPINLMNSLPMGSSPGTLPISPPIQQPTLLPPNFTTHNLSAPECVHPNPATKEIIHFKSCTLFPPNPAAPAPTTREKPNGCRTVFVGGLPEIMTEDIVREVFERCGEITTIRMSKKNFCHVRFELETYVEKALYLSGYGIRIGSNSDKVNIGRLHVDYAHARDDVYEWECRQRQEQREERHKQRMEIDRLRPPSPPSVSHFSEHEAMTLSENIKIEENFMKSVQTLICWLERGDCNKRNATTFYSLLQTANSHLKRLINDKTEYEEELKKAKELANKRIQGLNLQLRQVEKVFGAASHKKAWDHFTKAQRKNIETWKKQVVEVTILEEDYSNSESRTNGDDEMDLSDSDKEDQPEKKRRIVDESHNINQLKEENDSLRCQLEAFKNEVGLIKADLKSELDVKENQLRLLQQLLRESRSGIQASHNESTSDNEPFLGTGCDSSSGATKVVNNLGSTTPSSTIHDASTSEVELQLSSIPEVEARLIGLISTFLNVHPFGANLEYICSYTQKIVPAISPSQISSVLLKFPGIFREELSGVGASLERKWSFIGFHSNEN